MHTTVTFPTQPGGRFFTKSSVRGYRFGFNGKEKVDEVYGDANAYDFGARLYDPRLCRWLAVDPDAFHYQSFSPYSFVANMAIQAIDPDGNKIEIIGDKEYVKAVKSLLRSLCKNSSTARMMVKEIIKSNDLLIINQNESVETKLHNVVTETDMNSKDYMTKKALMTFNFQKESWSDDGSVIMTAETKMAHELGHFYLVITGKSNIGQVFNKQKYADSGGENGFFPADEVKVVEIENKVCAELSLPLREKYAGEDVMYKKFDPSKKDGNMWYITDQSASERVDFGAQKSNNQILSDKEMLNEIFNLKSTVTEVFH